MKKFLIIFLGLLLVVPAGYCSATIVAPMMMRNSMMIAAASASNRREKEKQEKIEICKKYQGGKACLDKKYLTKIHEER